MAGPPVTIALCDSSGRPIVSFLPSNGHSVTLFCNGALAPGRLRTSNSPSLWASAWFTIAPGLILFVALFAAIGRSILLRVRRHRGDVV